MNDGKTGRLQSLDAIRDFDLLWIMGLPALVCFFPACPVVAAVGKLALCWFVLWLLFRAKVFVKI